MCIRVNLQNNAVDSQETRNCIVQQQRNAAQQGIQAKRNEISQMPGEHSYLAQSEYGLIRLFSVLADHNGPEHSGLP